MANPFAGGGFQAFAGLLSGLGQGIEKYRKENDDSTAKALSILGHDKGNQIVPVRPDELEAPSLYTKLLGGGLRTKTGDQAFQIGQNYFAVRSYKPFGVDDVDLNLGILGGQPSSTQNGAITEQNLGLNLPATPSVQPAPQVAPVQPRAALAPEVDIPGDVGTAVRKNVLANVQAFQKLSPERRKQLDAIIDPLLEKYPNVTKEEAYAVVAQESKFNSRAVSPMGAQGTMQLMPETARRLGVKDPYDEAQNITGGIRELSTLKTRFGGNQRLTYAGYNSNANRAEERERTNTFPRETQIYIPAVMNTAARFKGLLANGFSDGPRAFSADTPALAQAPVPALQPEVAESSFSGGLAIGPDTRTSQPEAAAGTPLSQMVAGPATPGPTPQQEVAQDLPPKRLVAVRVNSGIADLTPEEYVGIEQKVLRAFGGQRGPGIAKEAEAFRLQQYKELKAERTEVKLNYKTLREEFHLDYDPNVRTYSDYARVLSSTSGLNPAKIAKAQIAQTTAFLQEATDPDNARERANAVRTELAAKQWPTATIEKLIEESRAGNIIKTQAEVEKRGATDQLDVKKARDIKVEELALANANRGITDPLDVEKAGAITRANEKERIKGTDVFIQSAQDILKQGQEKQKYPSDATVNDLSADDRDLAHTIELRRSAVKKVSENDILWDEPIRVAKEVEGLIDPRTGELAKVGMTARQIAERPFVKATPSNERTIEIRNKAQDVLVLLRLLAEGGTDVDGIVNNKPGEVLTGFMQAAEGLKNRSDATFGARIKTLSQGGSIGRQIALYDKNITGFTPLFGRGIGGDSGQFTDTDRVATGSLLPSSGLHGLSMQDARATAQAQFRAMDVILNRGLKRMLGAVPDLSSLPPKRERDQPVKPAVATQTPTSKEETLEDIEDRVREQLKLPPLPKAK